MYKVYLWVSAMLLLVVPLAAQTITVTSPNGREGLPLGSSFQIAWTTSGISQNVKIVLLREDNSVFGVIDREEAYNASPYHWTVGRTEVGDAPEGRYKIRIITLDSVTRDVSDEAFTISPVGSPPEARLDMQISSPAGGETWPLHSLQTIRWTTSGCTGPTQLYLCRWDNSTGNEVGLIAENLAASGSYSWDVGTYQGGTAEPGEQYLIRVWTRVNDHSYYGLAHYFTIGPEAGGGGGSHDLVISEPFLESRNGSKGFRVKVTDLRGDFNGWVVLSHYCMGMGLGNAVQDRRRLDLRRGVPAAVSLSNLRPTLFDGKCDVTFRFDVNPDHAVVETSYDNNVMQQKFCWENGHDGRLVSLRIGRNYTTACQECSVIVRPGDTESVDGETVNVRLEIMVQNCGNTAIRSAKVRTNYAWYFRDAGNHYQQGETDVDLVEGIDLDPGHFRILNRTVRLRRYPGSTLKVRLECSESGALNANNLLTCHPNFIGF